MRCRPHKSAGTWISRIVVRAKAQKGGKRKLKLCECGKQWAKRLVSMAMVLALLLSGVPAYAAVDRDQTKQNEFGGSSAIYIVELLKLDADTQRPVAGAVFQLYRWTPEGYIPVENGLQTTGPDGFLQIPNVEPGDYKFVEVRPPYGFETSAKPREWTFTVNENGQPNAVVAENKRLYRDLTLTKRVVVEETKPEPEEPAQPPAAEESGGQKPAGEENGGQSGPPSPAAPESTPESGPPQSEPEPPQSASTPPADSGPESEEPPAASSESGSSVPESAPGESTAPESGSAVPESASSAPESTPAESTAPETVPASTLAAERTVSLLRNVRRSGSNAFLLGIDSSTSVTSTPESAASDVPRAEAGPGVSAGAGSPDTESRSGHSPASSSGSLSAGKSSSAVSESTSGLEAPSGSGISPSMSSSGTESIAFPPADHSDLTASGSIGGSGSPDSISNSSSTGNTSGSSSSNDESSTGSLPESTSGSSSSELPPASSSSAPQSQPDDSSSSQPADSSSGSGTEQPEEKDETPGDETPKEEPGDTYFTFKITIHDGFENTVRKSYKCSIDGVEALIPIQSGENEIQLKADQTLVIHGLPVGASYEIIETKVDGYDTESENSNGNITENGAWVTFTNTKAAGEPEPGRLVITKYVDGNGADVEKEFTFTVRFTDGKGEVKEETFTLKHGESMTFENLPAGTKYTITEGDYFQEGYIQSGSTNFDGTIDGDVEAETTNTYVWTEMIEISGTKTWDDEGHEEERPQSVIVKLKNGDEEVVAQATVSGPDWKYSFRVPKYDKDGKEIEYTIEEVPVPYYQSDVTASEDGTVIDIKNTYQPPEQTTIEGEKTWDDNNNAAGARPESIKVYLKHGDIVVAEQEVTAANNWHYSFTVDKTDGFGDEIEYTVDESQIPGYKAHIDGHDITNTYDGSEPSPEYVELSGKKIWNHGSNPVENWPAELDVYLLANGEQIDKQTVSAANGWKYSFTNLPKYDGNGKLIQYAIDEEALAYYDKAVSGTDLVNTYNPGSRPEDDTVTVEGTKSWEHGGNPDSARPASITVYLYANGVRIRERLVTAADNWQYRFEDLPKFDGSGREIAYTVDEAPVPNYTRAVNGHDLKNTYSPPTTPVTPENPTGQVPQTSDPTPLRAGWALFWMGLITAGGAGAALTLRRRRRRWSLDMLPDDRQ